MTAAAIDYERAVAIVRGDNVEERMDLASNSHTPPEFLYYLSEDPDVGVRRAVGENSSTPSKADANLSKDDDVSVRCAVARKIVGEGLDPESRRDMWRMGFTILETLMQDSVVKVRRILSKALGSDPDAPREIVLGLAHDKEEEVAAPVLQESPMLTGDDLMAILNGGPPDWAEQSIAVRDNLSPALADFLIRNGHAGAVAKLIANPEASIPEADLEKLVDRSATVKELQPPLVERKDMSGGLLSKLARFVAQPLLKTLCGRKDLDQKSVSAINSAIESRDDKPGLRAIPKEVEDTATNSPTDEAIPEGKTPEARARQLFKEGSLTDDVVALALERWENNFVMEALALRAGYPTEKVRRMVRVKTARTMVSLSWKAGFTARFSMELQRHLACILSTKILNARDGVDYALSTADMENQLALFD
jgi:uncharacterized protein (DUF2336 family)